MFEFNTTYLSLPEAFYSLEEADKIDNPELLIFNENLARHLGFNDEKLSKRELAEYLSAQKLSKGSHPFSQVYAGHQFGHFNPRLGDGRALILGEIETQQGRLDVGLKGTGATIYSRGGDGKCPLGPALREYIVSESLYQLGVPTTRSLSVVKTHENVYREEALEGAIVSRVAQSHLRIGTFEYFAAKGESKYLKELFDYALTRHAPFLEGKSEEDKLLLFFREIGLKQVRLVAKWMSLGFIHGVMNTDNMTITGETIDFGPCAFMDEFDFQKTFSSIDQMGRYSYQNQQKIVLWNMARLAECFLCLSQRDKKIALKDFESSLDDFQKTFKEEFDSLIKEKLGLSKNVDSGLIDLWFKYLNSDKKDFTLSFRKLSEVLQGKEQSFHRGKRFEEFKSQWLAAIDKSGKDRLEMAQRIEKCNPLYIPRNHLVERAIENSYNGDNSFLYKLLDVLNDPFSENAKNEEFTLPPEPHERVYQTFCGT